MLKALQPRASRPIVVFSFGLFIASNGLFEFVFDLSQAAVGAPSCLSRLQHSAESVGRIGGQQNSTS